MRNEDRIEIQREMTFGETFSGTFAFLRENGAALLKYILLIAGPFILLTAILLGFFFPGYFSLGTDVDSGPFMDGTYVETETVKHILQGSFFLLSTALISMVTFVYVYLYTQIQDKSITLADVWVTFRKHFFRLLIAKIFMWLIIGLASMCFVIPSLIVYVLLGGTELLILEKKLGPFEAIGQSWSLMRQYWGTSFGLVIVMGVFVAVFYGLMAIPTALLQNIEQLTSVTDVEGFQNAAKVLNAITQVITHLLFLLPTVAISLRYYSVKEEHYREGIIRRIRNVGRAIEEDIYKEDEQY